MSYLSERDLRIEIPAGVNAIKFDSESHGFMKAVDFIIEENNRIIFMEFKDPYKPETKPKDREEWIAEFKTEKKDSDLCYKYRDSFLYEWASGKIDDSKKHIYCVLVSLKSLDAPLLMTRSDALRRKLPVGIPEKAGWKRPIADACMVFNIESWNKHFPRYRVSRVSASTTLTQTP